MAFRKGYIFTSKNHPRKGIMATILGILSIITLGTAVYFSYMNGGESSVRYAMAGLLAVVYMIVGMGLGIWSIMERDVFKLFPVLGIVVNTIAFGFLSLILYAGAYVE